MRAEIEGWSASGGEPTFRVHVYGSYDELSSNDLSHPPHIGFSMRDNGTFFAWFNAPSHVIKQYPVIRDNPYVARSTLRLLDAVIDSRSLRMELHYEVVGGHYGVIKPEVVAPRIHKITFNTDSIQVWRSMRDRLLCVMTEKGIATEEVV